VNEEIRNVVAIHPTRGYKNLMNRHYKWTRDYFGKGEINISSKNDSQINSVELSVAAVTNRWDDFCRGTARRASTGD
jgi:hypothetical protein